MARNRQPGNLAARMGRWSAAHWKAATFGWLAFVAVAFALGGLAGTKSIDPSTSGPGESGRMDRILDAGFRQPAGESVLVQSRSLRVGDPAFTAAVEDVVARISTLADVQNVRSPLDPGHADQISKDGRSALVELEIRGDRDEAVDRLDPILAAVAAAGNAHPGFFIGVFGDASAAHAVDTVYSDDLEKAGLLSLPITLVILVVAFGALVAAGIPLLLALTAVFATFGLIALASHLLPQAQQAPALVLLIGLAVGVDYSMFYLKRERQERAAGRGERAALEAAAATSGRSVLVSGLTVIVAMAGMFLTGDRTFASLGVAAILVVAIAVLGSLTVLPALLSRLGDRVDRLRVPLAGRMRRDPGEGRIWCAIVDRVLRRPVLSAVLAGGLLLALAAPALQLRMATEGPDTLPQSLPAIETYNRMQQAFPGAALPAQVVVEAPNVNAPALRDAIERLEQQALASGRAYEPITVAVNEDATVANITVPIAGTGADAASTAALSALREEIVPGTVGALPNVEAGVTGLTAAWNDSKEWTASKLPFVVAFVLVLAFVLMLVAFRSLVIAAKTIVLNLLSVAAAYGVLVLVFQHGVGKGLLGFSSTAGIDPVVPLLLFVILFGLSMDYHVFILSRIRESFRCGASTEEAIAYGITSTAGVVTSAAIVMVVVFAIFATLSMLFFKQFGVGLAAAILIDATIVRAVLLPATMKLLGDWNWYLPTWLRWLPRLGSDEPTPGPRRPARRRTGARAPSLVEKGAAMKAGRIALVTTGCVAAMLAAALLAGAVWLFRADTDSVGYVVSGTHEVETPSYAFASTGLDLDGDFDWLYDRGPKLRVRAESDEPLFIGIARSDEIARYLAGVPHEQVTDLDLDTFALTTERRTGAAAPAAPAGQTFWAASVQGAGLQTLEWDGGYGQWSVVVMNADASPGVAAGVSFGAHLPHLTWIAIGGAIGGGVLLVVAAGLIVLGVRLRPHPPLAPTPAAPVA